MKTTVYYPTNRSVKTRIAYPNAASRRQVLGRIIDLLVMAASGAGAAAIVLFLLALA